MGIQMTRVSPTSQPGRSGYWASGRAVGTRVFGGVLQSSASWSHQIWFSFFIPNESGTDTQDTHHRWLRWEDALREIDPAADTWMRERHSRVCNGMRVRSQRSAEGPRSGSDLCLRG